MSGDGPGEATATIVHRVLGELGADSEVLLWNLVPTHPHLPGEPESNRRPTRGEIEAAHPFLERVARGRRLVPVGRLAQTELGGPYIRHPVARRRSGLSRRADSIACVPESLPIRRNTALLAATMAVNSAVLQLVAAVSSLTFVLVTGVEGLLGLGPAIFLTASALTAVPAGRSDGPVRAQARDPVRVRPGRARLLPDRPRDAARVDLRSWWRDSR